MRALVSFLLCCVAFSCTTPPGPPAEVGSQIIAAIEAQDGDEATRLYRRIRGKESYRQRIYPVLFDAAKVRYEKGESAGAIPLLRFLVANYEDAAAARQALLYALFIERAGQAKPDAEIVKEMDRLLGELDGHLEAPPVWISLAKAQTAIDRGELDTARESFAAFKKDWDGEPDSLAIYVEDVERYLHSH